MIKVAYIAYNSYKENWNPEDLLHEFYTARDCLREVGKKNVKIQCFFRFHTDLQIEIEGVQYYFVKDHFPAKVKKWLSPIRFVLKIRSILSNSQPDVIHTHDLDAVMLHFLLKALMPGNLPILIQDHGTHPKIKFYLLQWLIFKLLDGFIFNARGQEEIWIKKALIPRSKCFFISEYSSEYKHQSRVEARSITGWQGDPIFIWVANLKANKDPFTVLQAFERTAEKWPDARLYMIYRQDNLLSDVASMISSSTILCERVRLVGSKTRSELEPYYNCADYILIGSHRESYGYAVLEAISCGVIPIITDIPSHKKLTGNGSIGLLWDKGSVMSLEKCLRALDTSQIKKSSQKVLDYFSKNLTFDVLVDQTIEVYGEAIHNKTNDKIRF